MKIVTFKLLAATLLVLTLSSGDSAISSNTINSAPSQEVSSSKTKTNLNWKSSFQSHNWMQHWGVKKRGQWGLENILVVKDASRKFSRILRVNYPAGSASPQVTRKNKAPTGGAGFYADLGMSPQDALHFSYYVRFSENFDFVKGGKLPGLFGGTQNNGGKIPDGTDGFSTRFMWRKNGDGEIYAYLPSSKKFGTSIGRGNWRFIPGKWHKLEQRVFLNDPDKNNGRIQVFVDGKQVLNKKRIYFRTTNKLKIEGIFFSTFFGGGDKSWSTPKDVFVDFANFSVSPLE